jgi:hypothetical protein
VLTSYPCVQAFLLLCICQFRFQVIKLHNTDFDNIVLFDPQHSITAFNKTLVPINLICKVVVGGLANYVTDEVERVGNEI